jgi:hypothetical protein
MTAISHLRDECESIYYQTASYRETAKILCDRHPEIPNPNHVRGLIPIVLSEDPDDYEDEELDPCDSDLQKERNLLRIERTRVRNEVRRSNAFQELMASIRDDLSKLSRSMKPNRRQSKPHKPDSPVLVVHLSDLHLNAVIDTATNQYDFVVAAKRLQKLAMKVKAFGIGNGVTKIVVAMGGDFLKNDKRTDEYLTNAANRFRSSVVSVLLLRQFILDLRAEFELDLFAVAGNESRTAKDISWAGPAVTDNYDSIIYWMLELSIQGDKKLVFHPHQGNEEVFSIHKETFL